MTDNLRQFMNDVLDIKPPYGDIASNGIPGMGMPNMGADVTNGLRKSARTFAEAYAAKSPDQNTVQLRADELEGAFMAAVTVGVLETGKADTLVQNLHDLLEKS